MAKGYISLHRQIEDNWVWFAEAFSKGQAWVDMLILANHRNNFIVKRGIRVEINRGQIGYCLDTLCGRWKWSRGKVERFMILLENDKQIVRQKTNITTLISILNYEKYQTNDNADSKVGSKADGKANGQQTVKQTEANNNDNNDNNVYNGNNENNIIPEIAAEINFSMLALYHKSFDSYKIALNGQGEMFLESDFKKWKQFVDFIYEKKFEDLFGCKFISPFDFKKLINENDFPESKWESVLKKILSSGVKKEHNLYFRIPEFIKYTEKENKNGQNNSGTSTGSNAGKQLIGKGRFGKL